MKENKDTVIIGLGNPICSDDGVGIKVAEMIKKIKKDIEVKFSFRGGFELLDLLKGFKRAVIIDALDIPEPNPGRVRKLGINNFSGSPRLVSVHEIDLLTAVNFGRLIGYQMPKDIEIYAVEAEDTKTISERLTPKVEEVVVPLANRIVKELEEQGG